MGLFNFTNNRRGTGFGVGMPGFNKAKRSSISNGDWDGDGVKNRGDCQAFNFRKQDRELGVEDNKGYCESCGRYTANLSNFGECKVCSRMNYAYDQGAVTLDKYKEWEHNWKKK